MDREKDWVQKAEVQWAKEPVSLQGIDAKGITGAIKKQIG